jgi:hypothetical protein
MAGVAQDLRCHSHFNAADKRRSLEAIRKLTQGRGLDYGMAGASGDGLAWYPAWRHSFSQFAAPTLRCAALPPRLRGSKPLLRGSYIWLSLPA